MTINDKDLNRLVDLGVIVRIVASNARAAKVTLNTTEYDHRFLPNQGRVDAMRESYERAMDQLRRDLEAYAAQYLKTYGAPVAEGYVESGLAAVAAITDVEYGDEDDEEPEDDDEDYDWDRDF